MTTDNEHTLVSSLSSNSPRPKFEARELSAVQTPLASMALADGDSVIPFPSRRNAERNEEVRMGTVEVVAGVAGPEVLGGVGLLGGEHRGMGLYRSSGAVFSPLSKSSTWIPLVPSSQDGGGDGELM